MTVSQDGTEADADGEGFAQRVQAVAAASQALNDWIFGAQNFALLRAALAAGIIEALHCGNPAAGCSR